MPYFIYKITPGPTQVVRKLELQADFENFNEAKTRAREMRAELGAETDVTIKVMFAATPLEAEEKLQEHREAPILREWEK